MPEEREPFRARLADAVDLDGLPGPLQASTGVLGGVRVAAVRSGIGIANAASAATWALLMLRPRIVISAGSAGGLDADAEVGDVVISDRLTYSLADATAFGYVPGQLPGGPEHFAADPLLVRLAQTAGASAGADRVRTGTIVSGDAFVTAVTADPMRKRFPGAFAADMESCALAQVCAAYGVPFVSVRGISDLCGPRADQDFHLALDVVADLSARVITQLVASWEGS